MSLTERLMQEATNFGGAQSHVAALLREAAEALMSKPDQKIDTSGEHVHGVDMAAREGGFVAEWTKCFGFLATENDPSSIESIDEVACLLNFNHTPSRAGGVEVGEATGGEENG